MFGIHKIGQNEFILFYVCASEQHKTWWTSTRVPFTLSYILTLYDRIK